MLDSFVKDERLGTIMTADYNTVIKVNRISVKIEN
jgi:hypothetical protein